MVAILPSDGPESTWRTAVIQAMTVEDVQEAVGFPPNVEDDPDKVAHSWAFTVNGMECAVWDYKGSEHRETFSAFGPIGALRAVFGNHVSEG